MFRFEPEHLRAGHEAAFRTRRRVLFQDVDAAGIVFYPRVLEYFHDAYLEFLEASGSPLPQVLERGLWAAPISHAEADFRRPLGFGDDLAVEIVAAHVEGSEVTLGFRVVAVHVEGGEAALGFRGVGEPTGEVAATGQSVHVFVHPDTFERIDVPASLLEALSALSTD